MIRMLTLDGGGILGIVPAMVLAALERKIQEKTGDANARLIDHLDFLAGTSTGGIIACILACPKSDDDPRPRFSAADAVDFYKKYGPKIFKTSWLTRVLGGVGLADERYDAATLEQLLKKHFGGVRLSQLLKPCLVTAYNLELGQTYFFCQHDHARGPKAERDFLVRDVCRSTSAAPSYFEPSKVASFSKTEHPFIDGGVFANNPTLCAIAEVSKAEGAFTPANMLLLSLGTGRVPQTFDFRRFKTRIALLIVPDLIKIMMSGVAETTHHIVKNVFKNLGVPENYIRIDPEFSDAKMASMDNASPSNIERLQQATERLILEKEGELDALAERLLASGGDEKGALLELESFQIEGEKVSRAAAKPVSKTAAAPPKLRWAK